MPYKPAGTLPLGYLKRLELGRCLALRPELIICDEIFSGLSPSEINTLIPLLEKLQLELKKREARRGGERITVMGSILYEGRDISALDPSDRARQGIVLCPERRRIFPESSALENLKIGGHLASRAQAKKTLEYVFTLFPALKDLKRREGGFLSGGEQQMLAIGRALMAQPRLLLLDEPLLGLSPKMEDVLIQAVQDINRETGITVLIAEQYARPILPIIDYAYVLENGGAVVEGTAAELLDNPDVKSAYLGI